MNRIIERLSKTAEETKSKEIKKLVDISIEKLVPFVKEIISKQIDGNDIYDIADQSDMEPSSLENNDLVSNLFDSDNKLKAIGESLLEEDIGLPEGVSLTIDKDTKNYIQEIINKIDLIKLLKDEIADAQEMYEGSKEINPDNAPYGPGMNQDDFV